MLRLGGPKEQVILAALIADAGHVVSVDRLCDVLWGEDQPATATKTLRSYVSRLRNRLKPLESEIRTVSGGYVLDAASETIDTLVFEDLVAEARDLFDREQLAEATQLVETALSLWRGSPYHGLDDYDFAHMEAVRLEERRLEAIELHYDALIGTGRHVGAVASLENLVEQHPLRERLWRSLMIALYRSGRQADALRAFQRAREVLGEELGIEPSPELRQLEESILLQRPEMAAPAGSTNRFFNLPDSRTSFIGREDELDEISSLLDQYRCVTITGAGGSGKTRLAIETARAATYRNGVVMVELAGLGDPRLVPDHVADAIGDVGTHADDALDAIADYLSDSELLLLIDNCEHLIVAAADFIDSILDLCPHIHVLATSREPLRTEGEAVFVAPPLEVPSPDDDPSEQEQAEAIRLFVDRARAYDREFSVDDENRRHIVRICVSLDGIPLAIELAAARTRTMSVAEISQAMEDRFQLLTAGRRTAPERHQTLKAAIDWSYDLCPPEAQAAMRRLSVFSGGFSKEAAVAVVGAPPIAPDEVGDLIARLVDKSLVERAVTAGESRFWLLETIRQYGFDALVAEGEAAAARRRHRDWYLSVASQATARLRGSDQVTWWKRLDADHDNLRSALTWSFDNGETSRAFRLVAYLGWFWFMRAHWREAWRWTKRALDIGPDIDPLGWARVIHATGSLEVIRGNIAPIEAPLQQALEISRREGSRVDEAWCLHYQGHAGGFSAAADARTLMEDALTIFEELGDDPWAVGWSWRYIGQVMPTAEEQIDFQRRALDRFLELGDEWCASFSLYLLGNTFLAHGLISDAIEANSRSRSIARDLDDIVWYAHATGRLGYAARLQGDPEEGLRLIEEGIELHSRIGDDLCHSLLLACRGLALADLGRMDEALRSVAQGFQGWRDLNNRTGITAYFWIAAEVVAKAGRPGEAVEMLGATAAESEPMLRERTPFHWSRRKHHIVALEAELGQDAFRRHFARGEELGWEWAVDRVVAYADAEVTG